jgi:hypothetical protein
MKPINKMSQIEIAALVQSHLHENGITVILSGGAATSYFCQNKYVSADIDLVNIYRVSPKKITIAMNTLGFQESGRHFVHPESQYIVEFPPGPLMVGIEPVMATDQIPLSTGCLEIISATDCIKDRLAAFYHWGDQQCFRQAILVANSLKVDLKEIERWSIGESKLAEYERFLNEISPQ